MVQMESKVGGNDHHHLRRAHQLNGGQMIGLGMRLYKRSAGSSRTRRSNNKGRVNDPKVVYISNLMKVRTSDSKFRDIVQELTGKHSDVARIMESDTTTTTNNESQPQQDILYWTTVDDEVDGDHRHHNQYHPESNRRHQHNQTSATNHQVVLPLGVNSSSATPAASASEPFRFDDSFLAVVNSSSSSSRGAGNDLNYDHFLMVDEGNLLGSTSFTYPTIFHGDGQDQYFSYHENFEVDNNILY